MINIEDLNSPAFFIYNKNDKMLFNKKFDELNNSLKERITKQFNEKNFTFFFQEKNYHIVEIASNLYIVIQEISESHQSIREATRHSMALQMRILNELGEGVFIEDKTGKIIFANPSAEKILDLVSYEIVGQSFLSFIVPDEEKIRVERIFHKLTAEVNEVKSARFETQIKNKQGDIIYLLVYYSVMLTNKAIEGTLITIYDISDIKKLTKEIEERSNELLQAEKLSSIGLLASGISHELNNPLAFIISNTSALEDYIRSVLTYLSKWEDLVEQSSNDKKFKEVFHEIIKWSQKEEIELIKNEIFDILQANQRGLNRLSDVISDLRKFSHTNKEDSERKEVIDIAEPINLSLNLLSYELKSIDVQLLIDKNREKYLIFGNAKLYQVFLNIIYNASQSIAEKSNQKNKGKIIIKIFENNNRIMVQIADNGIGISEKALPRIFDPFYTTKPPGIGTGLGLSISQRIINDLGGYIVAESGTILSGATFTLFFPIYEN